MAIASHRLVASAALVAALAPAALAVASTAPGVAALGLVPRPQELVERGSSFTLGGKLALVLLPGAEGPALRELLVEALERYGPATVRTAPDADVAAASIVVAVAAGEGAAAAAAALAAVGGDWARDDPGPEGYILIVRGARVVVAGHDRRGAWYGAVTLARLLGSAEVVSRRSLPGLFIRDWPDMAYRSVFGIDLANLDPELVARAKAILAAASRLKLNMASLENHNWAMLDREAKGQRGRKVHEAMREVWDEALRLHLTPRPEGWLRYFPAGAYDGEQRPSSEASDPTILEGIRATTPLTLAGIEAQPLVIAGVSGQRYPVANVLHDLATGRSSAEEPVVVRGAAGEVYGEGRDWVAVFGAIRAPFFTATHKGDGLPAEAPRWAESGNPPTTIRRTRQSAIPDGATVEVSFSYIGPDPHRPSKVRECLSDPRLRQDGHRENLVQRFATGAARYFAPQQWSLTVDEYRVLGYDERCRRSGRSRAQIYSDYIAYQIETIGKARPGATILMWSDMLDPNHNARKYGTEGALEDLARRKLTDLVLVPWGVKTAAESVALLARSGFPLMASCQERGPDHGAAVWAHHLRRAFAGRDRRYGLQYTTWDAKEGFDAAGLEALAAVAQAAWSAGPFLTVAEPEAVPAHRAVTLTLAAAASPFMTEAGAGGRRRSVPGRLGKARVTIHFRTAGERGFRAVAAPGLDRAGRGTIAIPAEAIAAPGLEYWIEIEAAEGITRLPREAPHRLLTLPVTGR